MESLKRIANIANLSLDMSELNQITATQTSNNDISWDANFAMLVEYVGENFKLPEQSKSKLGKWYTNEKGRSSTTARRVHIQGMKAIISILNNCSRLRKLGSDEKIRVKKMISELKSFA